MNNKIKKFQGGTVLPEITVVPNKLFLYTYYPLINSRYPFTGHSELRVSTPDYFRDMGNGYAERVEGTSAHINKKMKDSGYNLVTNNCADATRCALETILGKEMNPYFFTTPGDVLDFFKENFDVRKVKNDGKRRGQETWYTNITPLLAEVIKNQLYELIQENKKDKLKLLANARKWKHKKGGKAFVEGVNVLDSNPDAYKYVKKKYKMRSAAGGSKVDWGGVANTIGGLSNSVMNIAKTFKNQKAIDLMKEANASKLNATKNQAINDYYRKSLANQTDRSDIVNRTNAYNEATNSASQIVALKQQELDLQVSQAEQANAAAQLEAWTGAIKDLGGLAINALNKKGMTLKAANLLNNTMFSKNVNVGGTDYKAFNTPTYKSFGDWADANTFKKEGTIDSNGFMNTRLGKMDMNFNIVPIKTELFKT